MPLVTLSNGIQRVYNHNVSVIDIASDIDSNLAKYCIAGIVNGKLVDSIDKIDTDSLVSIITIQDDISLEIIRNSCVNLLSYAIKKIWPYSQIALTKTTDNGFFCDIDNDYTLNSNDLILLEKKMNQLVSAHYKIIKLQMSIKEALIFFQNNGENYRLNLINNKQNKYINVYNHQGYIDICSGPQVPNIKFCSYFKIQKVSGAYWQGNSNNKMLQRICGTAWANKKQLEIYLHRLEESIKRDHRKIGKQLDLYHIQEDSPGMVFWHNDGWTIFNELKKFIASKLKIYEYQEVTSPLIMEKALWEKTGHWENYKESMFTIILDNKEYCIKPMNCPGHIQIFNQGLKSYRDLPLRIAEFGNCHRNELSGALHGLMRVCSFTQDDAHIFCTEDQVQTEISNCIRMVYDIYKTFGFEKVIVNLSTRPTKRIGVDTVWDNAEKKLILALKENNITFNIQPGEGAFYGPKIEFTLLDCINRAWQCGTIQLDFSLPKRLNSFYIDKNNNHQTPVLIHRAILGSIERFIGILIEEFSGWLPTWLAPIQVVIMNITDKQQKYVKELFSLLQKENFRVNIDIRNEKIGFKIRDHTLRRIPYILICGNKEIKNGDVSVRTRKGKDIGSMDIHIFIKQLHNEICSRNLYQLEE
ncbi:MAG: threonine--tRNA ligase [Pantoea sp. Brub]|nr:threonine--tRNA ligase [Pantoea sp. Brub]